MSHLFAIDLDQLGATRQFLLFEGLLLVLFVLLLLFFRERSEQRQLLEATRELFRTARIPSRLSFTSAELRSVWHLLLNFHYRGQNERDKQFSAGSSSLLSLASRLSESLHDESGLAEEIIRTLIENTRPDVVAAALIQKHHSDGHLQLTSVVGLHHRRVREPLLGFAEEYLSRLIDNSSSDLNRISIFFVDPTKNSFCDLSAFGVGQMLVLPLYNQQVIEGIIWLGLAPRTTSLSASRREYLKEAARHALSCLIAARRTQRRVEESAQERDFLLGVSHDLRAPGSTALHCIREVLNGELGALSTEQHLRLSIVERNIEDQLEIVSDVLNFARHQRGLLTARPSTVIISSIFERLVERFEYIAAQKGLQLVASPPQNVILQFDSQHLTRILANLISNAIRYTDSGNVCLSAGVDQSEGWIRVADTGLGIPRDKEHLLFKEFSRLASADTNAGTGLGLALSKVLAELNGGRIEYSANPNGGSIFTLYGPIGNRNYSSRLTTALVLDDDLSTCRANAKYLSNIVEHVRLETDPNQALQSILLSPPELLVTDYQFCNTNAQMLFQELARHSIRIPTVVVSGAIENPILKKLEDSCAWLRLLDKPASREELLSAIDSIFAQEASMTEENNMKA